MGAALLALVPDGAVAEVGRGVVEPEIQVEHGSYVARLPTAAPGTLVVLRLGDRGEPRLERVDLLFAQAATDVVVHVDARGQVEEDWGAKAPPEIVLAAARIQIYSEGVPHGVGSEQALVEFRLPVGGGATRASAGSVHWAVWTGQQWILLPTSVEVLDEGGWRFSAWGPAAGVFAVVGPQSLQPQDFLGDSWLWWVVSVGLTNLAIGLFLYWRRDEPLHEGRPRRPTHEAGPR